MSRLKELTGRLNRRSALTSGAGAMAGLLGLGMASHTRAQGTPEASGAMSLAGMWGVTRSYVLKEDANVDDLNAIVQGFVDIVSDNPGFISYNVIHDPDSRGYVTISIFDNQDSALASNEEAAQHIVDNDVAQFYVDPQPVIVQGMIVVSHNN